MPHALAWLCAALVVLGAHRAHADGEPEYERVIREALQEYRAGNWPEATGLFLKAHAIAPSARTHRGLGLCYFEARDYVQAVQHLSAALSDTRHALSAEQQKSVQEVLARAHTMVGTLALRVAPEDASVLIDGRARGPDGGPIMLAAGAHRVSVSAPGYRSEERTVDVVGEQKAELGVELEAQTSETASLATENAAAQAPSRDVAPARDTESGGSRLAPVLVLAGGGALLGTALVTGLLEHSREQKLVDAGCERSCDARYEADRQSARTLQVATNVLLAAGASVAVGGALWLLLGGGSGGSGSGDTAPKLSFGCDRGGCAAALRGSL